MWRKGRSRETRSQQGPYHLSSLNQPRAKHDSDCDPFVPVELFDAPKAPHIAKKLLAAAIKVREQSNVADQRAAKGDTNKDQHISSLRLFHCEVWKD
jgi:hypothetical protein